MEILFIRNSIETVRDILSVLTKFIANNMTTAKHVKSFPRDKFIYFSLGVRNFRNRVRKRNLPLRQN